MSSPSVQKAHDALLAAMPAQAVHERCPLCVPGRDADKEVAQVADAAAPVITGNQYSEAQHFALLKSAVEQETSALTTEKSEMQSRLDALESEKAALATELSEAHSKIDVLESDKTAALAAAETVQSEFAAFKAEIERSAQIAELKDARRDRVKAANEHLVDGYFSDERITRWAEMSEENFETLVSEMTEFAAAAAAKKDDGDEDDKPDFFKKKDDKTKAKTSEKAAETAAFTGGETAKSASDSGGSTLSQLLATTRHSTAV